MAGMVRTLEDPPPSHVRKPPLNHRSAVAPTPSHRPVRQSFAALRNSGYRAQFVTYFLAMMADNIEHVISYWVMFRKFHSPALAGFAVLSHWLPFLLFSVASGVLADRFDPPSAAWACSSWPRPVGATSSSPTRLRC